MVLQTLSPQALVTHPRMLSIRTARPKDLARIQYWATREDWNPGQQDLMVYQQQQGLYVAEMGDRLVGCISAIRYTQDFGFIGCYLVDIDHRGRGYGHQLWSHALQTLAGATIGLEGAIALQKIYCQNGFVRTYHHVRYELQREPLSSLTLREADVNGLRPIQDLDISQVNAYDRQHFACDRQAFLRSWLNCDAVNGVVYLEKGQVKGYGCIRPAVLGHRIGPLFADSPQIAKGILKSLGDSVSIKTSNFRHNSIFLDIPHCNTDAIALMAQLQAQERFSNCRMYLGTIPVRPTHNIYGNTTLEAG